MKELNFICAQPDNDYYIWQVHLWIESLRELGHSDEAIVLIFIPKNREKNNKWKNIISLYPEVEFVFYKDEHFLAPQIRTYIPIIRPYVLWRYFKDCPDMKNKAVFYCDCDILFLEGFNLDKFMDDDIVYLSNTNSYTNAKYFDNKKKVQEIDDPKGTFKKGDPVFALKERFEEFKKIDVLAKATSYVGINRQICELNNEHSGGAQYFLKGIDATFWKKVWDDCISIRVYLQSINRQYFKNESKGYQSWCADMFSILWNLWLKKQETRVVPELDFAWATDPIEKLKTCTIFHNAGINSDIHKDHPAFWKGKYHRGGNPLLDPHLEEILTNEESKKWCTWYYASKLKALSNKYKLKY